MKIQVAKLPLEHAPRASAARDPRGVIKLVAEDGTGPILGAHLVVSEAGEMIVEPTLHPHLTLAEEIKPGAQTFDKDVLKPSCCEG